VRCAKQNHKFRPAHWAEYRKTNKKDEQKNSIVPFQMWLSVILQLLPITQSRPTIVRRSCTLSPTSVPRLSTTASPMTAERDTRTPFSRYVYRLV
jgi:hypothetical protein